MIRKFFIFLLSLPKDSFFSSFWESVLQVSSCIRGKTPRWHIRGGCFCRSWLLRGCFESHTERLIEYSFSIRILPEELQRCEQSLRICAAFPNDETKISHIISLVLSCHCREPLLGQCCANFG